MPYITKAKRLAIEQGQHGPATPGELNFVITMICNAYLEADLKAPNYTTLNAIVGVLECAKLEFYRRIVSDYENEKIEENGDVYSNHIKDTA